jgi:predicted house-cleaning noncanonical NTP pyrophosphatase (MazG superfamily)
MAHIDYDKLVRDRIPAILAERGIAYQVRVATPAERPALLRAKLAEEVAEFLAAADDPGRLAELADLLEVILALAELSGADAASLESLRVAKASERGALADGIVLLSTDA